MELKHYRVKVTEIHSDYVWVLATTEKEAKSLAVSEAQCEFESVQDCVITDSFESI